MLDRESSPHGGSNLLLVTCATYTTYHLQSYNSTCIVHYYIPQVLCSSFQFPPSPTSQITPSRPPVIVMDAGKEKGGCVWPGRQGIGVNTQVNNQVSLDRLNWSQLSKPPLPYKNPGPFAKAVFHSPSCPTNQARTKQLDGV